MSIEFEPQTIVRILANVPLDNTYRNTIDFAGAGETDAERLSAQQQYFLGKTKYSFSDFTYQRLEGRIRVPINCELLYDCNYVMYQNKNFANKWFYAFITNIEYANPEMTWITFEIDVYQTWLTEMRWKKSFILREHVQDDSIGANLVPEDLDTGEYIYQYLDAGPSYLNTFCILVSTTSTPDENVSGTNYNGIYSGSRYYAFDADDIFDIQKFLNELDKAGKGDAISAISMFPKSCVTYDADTHEVVDNGIWEQNYNIRINGGQFGHYYAKNKKLYGFPYTILKVTGNNGNDAQFELEYFPNSYDAESNLFNLNFNLRATIASNPTIICIPEGYKCLYDSQNSWDTLILQNNFPQCSWSYGTYENWYAANSALVQLNTSQIARNARIDTAQGAIGTAVQGAGAVANLVTGQFGGAFNSALGAVNTGIDTYQGYKNAQDAIRAQMLNVYAHSIQPPQTRGNNSMGTNVAFGLQNFFFYTMAITENYARRIDDYFTFYGYKVNKFEIPNLHTRAHFNYIETIDCNIEGSFPELHIEKLKSIFNKGITIWHFGNEVNAYELPNEIITYTLPDYGR